MLWLDENRTFNSSAARRTILRIETFLPRIYRFVFENSATVMMFYLIDLEFQCNFLLKSICFRMKISASSIWIQCIERFVNVCTKRRPRVSSRQQSSIILDHFLRPSNILARVNSFISVRLYFQGKH